VPQPLTTRQREIYDFLVHCVQTGELTPSLREIGAHFQISSTNGVARHLDALRRKGWITWEAGKARAVRIVALEGVRPTFLPDPSQHMSIPLLGRVAAGLGLLAEENREGDVVVDPDLFGGGDSFALRVQGDSMIEEGIHEGDLVIVRPQRTATNGDIVVALLGGEEATVKFFYDRGRYIELCPANPSFTPIVVPKENENMLLIGKVIGLMRRY
jgi:repressor LexA